jgi:FkbM family methyltransferase
MTNFDFSKNFNIFYKTISSLNGSIVVYGNGTVGKTIQALIPDKVIGYVDIAVKENHPSTLKSMQFDKIIISVLGREKEITKYLLEDLQIDKNKIIIFDIDDINTNKHCLDDIIEHKYKNFSIFLPSYSEIPKYQELYKKYDKFLPYLASHINIDETIIDIGANVGDSLAGMIEQNSNCSYLCIEADEYFFDFLCKNTQRIQAKISNSKIFVNNSLVGKNITGVSLEGERGTKHAVIDSNGKIKSKPLDEIVSMYPKINNIRLLKSDVDGFDYDVINSSLEVVKKYKPLIFFECQYDFKWQLNGYLKLFNTLNSLGYDRYVVLDNFGDIMLQTSEIKIIKQLIEYIERQNNKESTRTIYYFDILAVHKNDTLNIDDLISKFLL